MFLEGLDKFLIGKPEEPAKYEIELQPEEAFGKRNPSLIQRIPLKIFHEKKLSPAPGVFFNFDGKEGKILAVSGGRVMVDFNHALAGKDLVYNIKILRKVDDINEKINAFNEFFFRKDFKFEIKDKKIIMEVEKPLAKLAEMFKDKFKEVFDLELEVKEIEQTENKG